MAASRQLVTSIFGIKRAHPLFSLLPSSPSLSLSVVFTRRGQKKKKGKKEKKKEDRSVKAGVRVSKESLF